MILKLPCAKYIKIECSIDIKRRPVSCKKKKKRLTRTVQYVREYNHFSYDHIKALTTVNYIYFNV